MRRLRNFSVEKSNFSNENTSINSFLERNRYNFSTKCPQEPSNVRMTDPPEVPRNNKAISLAHIFTVRRKPIKPLIAEHWPIQHGVQWTTTTTPWGQTNTDRLSYNQKSKKGSFSYKMELVNRFAAFHKTRSFSDFIAVRIKQASFTTTPLKRW